MAPRTTLESSAPSGALDEISGGLLVRCTASDDGWERAMALAQAAAERGLGPIGVWSERAPSPIEVARAASFGVRELGFALHGGRREVHDWHAHRGAFDEVLAALTAARAHGIDSAIVSRVTRSNARVLVELPSLLKSAGVALWALCWPHPRGANRGARLGLALPAALAAMDRARRLGLSAWIVGAPACALGPFASRALASSPRAYGSRCAGCAMRAACPGLDATYLARFGEGELRPLARRGGRDSPPAIAALVADEAPAPALGGPESG